MPRPRLRVCSTPNCPAIQPANRCPEHARETDRAQRQFGSKASEPRDRARRKAAVDSHRAQYGNWCPGWDRPDHAADDLTADHVDEVSHGGAPDGELQVLCRSCNSRKNRARQIEAQQ